ncbi:dirigent protein 21-like [Salvia hispanica]|uniref:dirigent protein 21-like n=1 Tax=Salvia hispanica TaxID=49212 RepID=UPI0020098A59|nr:dirigent protein 21-like [Salvia hispanica]
MKNLPIALMLIISSLLAAAAAAPAPWVQTLTKGNKKITKLHFYVHNHESGPNTTVYRVAAASITSTSPTTFGRVNVLDDLVTAGPDINTEPVARVQGVVAYSDLHTVAIAMTVNFYITAGEFNKSTLCVSVRLPLTERLREIPVIGGTGAFRLARGYAVSTPYSFDFATANSVLEYTIYVITRSNEIVWTGF